MQTLKNDLNRLLLSLQERANNGGLANVKKKPCQAMVSSGGADRKCTHASVFCIGAKVECSLHKWHDVEENYRYYCLIHMLELQSGEPVSAPLLDIMKGDASIDNAYDTEGSRTAIEDLIADNDAMRAEFEAAKARTDPEMRAAADAAKQSYPDDHYDGTLNESAAADEEQHLSDVAAAISGDMHDHVAFVPSATDEGACVCGWALDSPLERELHDTAHRTFLREGGTVNAAAAAPQAMEHMEPVEPTPAEAKTARKARAAKPAAEKPPRKAVAKPKSEKVTDIASRRAKKAAE